MLVCDWLCLMFGIVVIMSACDLGCVYVLCLVYFVVFLIFFLDLYFSYLVCIRIHIKSL